MKKTTTGTPRKFTWSKKKTAITSVSLVLALAMVVGLMPHTALRSYAAGAGVLTSVSGANNIPDTYDAVNVSADSIKNYQITDSDNNGLVAFDFHIFANEFASNAHTCGNVAVKDFGGSVLGESGAPEIGSREEHDPASVKMSYVQNPLNWTLVHNDLVLGDGNTLTGDGQVTLTAKNGKTYLFGNNNGGFLDNKYIDDESDSKPLINIQKELDEAEQYQKYLVNMMDDVNTNGTQQYEGKGFAARKTGKTGTYNNTSVRVLHNDELFSGPAFGPGSFGMGFGPGGKVIDLNKYKEDTIIIDFKEGSMWSWFGTQNYNEALNFLSGSVELKGTTGKRVIINIDTAGYPDMKFFDTHMKADKLTNEENSVHSDNNILWNFYDSSRNDGTSSKSKIEVGGTWMGTILAPDADVYCRAGLNGSIIANRVATTAETHKSDYTGEKTQGDKTNITVKKNWVNDNADSRPAFITVKLYQNDKLYETVQMTADGATGDTWTHEFKNLPKTDKAGKVYKYKVVEEPVAGYTGTVYNYTITNTSEGGTPKVDYFGSVTLKKTDGSNNLAGARFKLTSDDGNNLSSVVVNNADSYSATDNEIVFTTGTSQITIGAQKDGKATLPYGRYTLTEVSAPAGYKLDSTPVRFTLSGDSDGATMALNDIVNQPVSAKFIKLESQNHMALAGATLELTPNWGQSLSGVTVTGASGTPTVASDKVTFTSGTSEITFNKIPAGSYTITEITAPQTPDKYEIAAPITFNVDDNGNVTIDGQYKSRVEMLDDKTPEKPVIEYGNLEFTKTFEGTPANPVTFTLKNVAGKDISGDAEHPLKVNGENVTPTGDNKDTITFTLSGAGKVTVSNLLVGNYTITEGSNPGYKPVAPVSFSVAKDQTATASMTNEKIKIYISKKDATSGAELSGATLKLYDSNNTEYDSWTSDGTPHPITGIPAGTYTLKETAAPKGYVLPDPVPTSTFTVNADGSLSGANTEGSTVTMYNTPTVVKIIKKTTDGKVLAGAKLELSVISYVDSSSNLNNVTGLIETTLNEAGNTLTWTSATVAQELRGLPAGKYKLHEAQVPEGYTGASDIELVVDANGNVTVNDAPADPVVVENTKIKYYPIDIGKVDYDFNDVYLPGAKLAIFDADEKNLVEENAIRLINTTEEAQQLMLTPGRYVLVELEAPVTGPKTTTTGEGENATESVVTETVNGETKVVYEDKPYDKTDQRVYFTVGSDGNVDGIGLELDEDAGTQYGAPSDDETQNFSYDVECYYALETSDIFDEYGSFPTRVEFTLPEGLTLKNFKIVEDDGEDNKDIFIKTSDFTVENGKYIIPLSFSDADQYNSSKKYLAALELNQDVINADIELNFFYTVFTEGGEPEEHILTAGAGSSNIINNTQLKMIKLVDENDQFLTTAPDGFKLVFDVSDAIPDHNVANLTSFEIDLFALEEDVDINYENMLPYATIDNNTALLEKSVYAKWVKTGSDVILAKGNDTSTWDPDTQQIVLSGATVYEDRLTIELTKESDDLITYSSRPIPSSCKYFQIRIVIGGNYIDTVQISTTTKTQGTITNGGNTGEIGKSVLTESDITIVPKTTTNNLQIKLPNKKTVFEEGKTYPCAVELKKTKAGTNTTLPNAKFVLVDSKGDLVSLVKKTQTTGEGESAETTVIEKGQYEFRMPLKTGETAPENVVYVNTLDAPLVTDDDGKIYIDGLKEDTYTFREIEAPDGYTYIVDTETGSEITDTEVTLTDKDNKDNVKKVTVDNREETGEIEIIKYDENNNPKAGAEFYIYQLNLDGTPTDADPIGPCITDSAGKYVQKGLPLNYIYYAVETKPAPGTVIPDGLRAKDDNDVKQDYSKPLPRLNQVDLEDGSSIHESFYDVKNQLGGAKFAAKSADSLEGMLHSGIILGNTSSILYVANNDKYKMDDDGKYVLAAGYRYGDPDTNSSEIATEVYTSDGTLVTDKTTAYVEHNGDQAYVRVDPAPTGTIPMFNDSTKLTVLKTAEDGTTPLPGAQFKLTPPNAASDVPQMTGVSSATAQNFTYNYYAEDASGNRVPLIVEEQNDHTFKAVPADGENHGTLTYYEYITWTSSDGKKVDAATGNRVSDPDFTGDIIYGLPTGTYTVEEIAAPEGYAKVDGTMTVTTDSTALEVSNELLSDKLSVRATKVLNGRDLAAGDFTFTLAGESGKNFRFDGDNVTSITATNDTDGNIVFEDFATFTAADLYDTDKQSPEFFYTLTENSQTGDGVTYDTSTYHIRVRVNMVDGVPKAQIVGLQNNTTAVSNIKFTNSYSAEPVSAAPSIVKTLTGRDAAANEFTFQLKDGSEVIKTVKSPALTNDAASDPFKFEDIEFTEPGTYTYTISEVNENKGGVSYDGSVYTWTVVVKDPGTGTLAIDTEHTSLTKNEQSYTNAEFNNTYTVSGKVPAAVTGHKTYNKEFAAGTFSFILTEANSDWSAKNGVDPVTVSNDADGNFSFNKEYTAAGTYYYTITEDSSSNLGGVHYDDTVYHWNVTVSDKGDGTFEVTGNSLTDAEGNTVADNRAVFENTYSVSGDVSATVNGTKTLNGGKTLTDGMFTFKLTECTVDGETWTPKAGDPATVTNTGTNFSFTKTFNAAGTYYFTISEENGGQTIDGVTYDGCEYRWTVAVNDNRTGGFAIDEEHTTLTKNNESAAAAAFTNTYEAAGTNVTFPVSKTVTGKTNSTDVFTFKLHETTTDESVEEDKIADETVTVTGTGTASFTQINYTKPGTHTYEITEVVPNEKAAGITYDPAVYTWTVVVEDNGTGNLSVTKSLKKGTENVEGDTAAFTNIYKAIDISKTAVGGGAELDGASLTITAIGDVDLTGVSASKTTTVIDTTAKTIKWVSGGTANTVYGLPEGIYELKEEKAPNGYLEAESIYFKALADGTFKSVTKDENGSYIEGNVIDAKKVTMEDRTIDAKISKTAVTGGPELPGATLVITALDTNANLSNVGRTAESGGDEFTPAEKTVSWVSTDKSLVLKGLPVGTYAMTETIAPAGYSKATTIYFSVDEEGKLHKVDVKDEEGKVTAYNPQAAVIDHVEMVDEIRSATISKQAVGGGNELPDAVLTVTALSEGVKMTSVTSAIELDSRTETSVTWISGTTANTLSGLPEGYYELKEETEPDGYLKAEKMYFKVEENGTVKSVTVDEEGNLVAGGAVDKVVMFDDYNRTATISKQAVGGGNELPDAKLTVTALDEGVTLKDVTSEITATKSDDNKSITWTSTQTANKLSKLPEGKYELKEETAPEGYVVAECIYFKVSKNGTVTLLNKDEEGNYTDGNVVTDKTVVMFDDHDRTANISKQATGGGAELPGAKLTVTALGENADLSGVQSKITPDSRTEKSITWISGDEANTLSKLPAGEYQLKEVTAPKGFEIEEVIYFKVDENGTITNKTKTEYETEGSEWKPVTGKTVIMKDAPIEATISKKAVGGGDELPGAKLTVTSMYEDVKLDDVVSKLQTTERNDSSITWVSTNEANELSQLPVGVYQLKEVTSPDGYDVAEIIYFTVDQAGNVSSVPAKDYKADGTTDWKAVTDDHIIMEDAPTTATISKVDTGSGEELPGAKLTVTAMDENGTLEGVTSKLDAEKSDDNKSITWTSGDKPNELSKLPKGVYELKEVTAPNGYEVAEKIYFKVEENGIIKSVPEADYKGENTVWQPVDDKHIIMEDAPTPERTATISKVATDSGNELSGAKLTVTAKTEGVKLTDVVSKVTTDSRTDTSITWISGREPNELSQLPAGVYELEEVTAPNGYDVAEKIYFKVEEDGTVKSVPEKDYNGDSTDWKPVTGKKIIMEDALTPADLTATISKVATGSGNELPGAKLTVTAMDKDVTLDDVTSSITGATKSDNKKSITWISGDKPNVLSKLPAGVYELKEETAPNGYTVAEKIYFKVDEDGTVSSVPEKDYKTDGTTAWKPVSDKKIIMEDAPESKQSPEKTVNFEFTKKSNFDKALAGATFQLKGTDYDKTATSDAAGKVSFADVKPGTYSLTETAAPTGYNKYTGTITVTVSEDGNLSFKDFNSALTLAQVETALVNKVIVKEGPGNKNMKIGDSINLTQYLPAEYKNEDIIWKTDNGKVVTVDANGNAKVLGAGETKVYACTKDGTPLMSFVLGAEDEGNKTVVVADTVPNTRDLIIKYIKIASIALIFSSMIVFGCIYLFKRRRNNKAAKADSND